MKNPSRVLYFAASLFAVAGMVVPTIASASATSTPMLTATIVSDTTGPIFTRDLSLGSVGSDVMRLEQYLNTHGCPVANSGPGSYQMETSYFGPKTKAALICFQTDAGIKPASGNLGPITRRYIGTLP